MSIAALLSPGDWVALVGIFVTVILSTIVVVSQNRNRTQKDFFIKALYQLKTDQRKHKLGGYQGSNPRALRMSQSKPCWRLFQVTQGQISLKQQNRREEGKSRATRSVPMPTTSMLTALLGAELCSGCYSAMSPS